MKLCLARVARARTAAWLVIGLSACSPATSPLPLPHAALPQNVTVIEPAAAQGPPEQAWLRTHGELLVGSANGLWAYSGTGSDRRMISPGPALYPRWYDARHVLAVEPAAASESLGLERGAEIIEIDLIEGTRRALVTLPVLACSNAPRDAGADEFVAQLGEAPHLLLADPQDFVVDAQRRTACLQLMDAGWNTATMRIEARLDLARHSLKRWATLGLERCALPLDVQRGRPPDDGFCPFDRGYAASTEPAGGPAPGTFAFGFADEQVRRRDGTARVRVPGYAQERSSPSGRWLLLAGDLTEADAVYRRFVLLDRASGQLFAIPQAARPWPFPLATSAAAQPTQAAQPPAAPAIATPIESAAQWPGETDVRFVSDGLDAEWLIVERLVIRPGQDMFDVPEGSVAR